MAFPLGVVPQAMKTDAKVFFRHVRRPRPRPRPRPAAGEGQAPRSSSSEHRLGGLLQGARSGRAPAPAGARPLPRFPFGPWPPSSPPGPNPGPRRGRRRG